MSKMIDGTIEDIRIAARDAVGEIDYIYGHWTAGKYVPNHIDLSDYHILCLEDGSYLYREDFTERLAHTWKRNSRAIGIAFAGCFRATSNNLGEYAPTEAQIYAMAAAVRVMCDELGLPISAFLTHAEAADLDDYGPATSCERWDLWRLSDNEENGTGGDRIRELAKNIQV